jgi:plastocyanin
MRNGVIAAAIAAVVVAVGALLLAGGGSKSGSGSSQAKAGGGGQLKSGGKVDIADYKFKPANFTVKQGAKITFTNADSARHTATSMPSGAFDTGSLMKGQTKTVTFAKAGDFKYYCQFHAFMTGDVKVVK